MLAVKLPTEYKNTKLSFARETESGKNKSYAKQCLYNLLP